MNQRDQDFLLTVKNTIFPAYDGPSAVPQVELARATAVIALNWVPPGPLGAELFGAVAHHSISLPFEALALRRGEDGKLYVYLKKHADDDRSYPGMFHMPGKIKMPGESWADVEKRVAEEFGCDIANRRKIGEVPINEERGAMTSHLYLVDVDGETNDEDWYCVDELPPPMIDFHEYKFLPLAIAAFQVEEAEEELAAKRTWLAHLKKSYCDE